MMLNRYGLKRIIILFFAYSMSFHSLVFAVDTVYQGHVEANKSDKIEHSDLYTGNTEKLKNKDILKMTVSKVLDGTTAKEKDEFFAEVTDDLESGGGILIPRGTVAHGFIKRALRAQNMGRNGVLDLNFDYLITPDGKEIPIKGKMSTKLHPVKDASDVIASNLAYTAAGSLTGGLLSLGMAGLTGTVSSQGTILAGGAAIGGSAGLIVALSNRGKDVLISPGDEILVKVYTDSKLAVYKKTAFPQRELINKDIKVEINNIEYKRNSYNDVDKMILTVFISNMSSKSISTFDIALVNQPGIMYYPDTFDSDSSLKELKSGENFCGKIPFSVDSVKNKFWLTFYDNKTRQIISEVSVDNAYKKVSDKTRKQNEKMIKKKKDFYKDYNPFVD